MKKNASAEATRDGAHTVSASRRRQGGATAAGGQATKAPPAARQAAPAPTPKTKPPPLPPVRWPAHLLALATVAVLAVALYIPAVTGPFVYDDPNAVTQSQLVRRILPLTRFLTMSTRPLSDFSYALNYAMTAYVSWSYHLTNILLHALNALLVYGIAFATFSTPALARRYGPSRFSLAWAAAALFAVHPLASETVAYVSSRSEVLAAFFILLGLGSFIVAARTTNRRRRRLAAVVMLLAAFAGLGSKEIAAAIPFALLLYDYLFLAEGQWERTRPERRLVLLSMVPLAIGGTLLLIRAYVNPSPMGEYGSTAGVGFERFSRSEYFMTQFGVITHYLRLVVLPFGQTFDYDWPLAKTPFDLAVVLPFLLLVGLVVLAVQLARTQPLFTFAVGWTLLILAPTSSLLPIADLAVERRMYLPLAGIALLAAAWLRDVLEFALPALRERLVIAYAALVAIVLAAAGTLTLQRALLWGDAIALHEDGVAKAPTNPRVRLNLGVTYLNTGNREQAYRTLLEAKTIYDSHESVQAFPRIGAFIQYNLGAVMYSREEYDRAEPELRRSLELGGQYLALRPMALMLLSRIEARRADWKGAARDMKEALQYQDNPEWRVDLAQMQFNSGDRAAAQKTLKNFLFQNPNHERAKALAAKVNSAK